MHAAAARQWGRADACPFRTFAALLALGLSVSVLAGEPLPKERAPAGDASVHIREMSEGGRCGSVVMRRCHLRRETSATVLDPGLTARNGAPMQWEVVQYGGPDNDEIVVYGQRIRDLGLKEVFDRTFGLPLQSRSMHTRTVAAGARCTTLDGSSATLCSNGGNRVAALENPLTDWVF
jgi:hypothetical protein